MPNRYIPDIHSRCTDPKHVQNFSIALMQFNLRAQIEDGHLHPRLYYNIVSIICVERVFYLPFDTTARIALHTTTTLIPQGRISVSVNRLVTSGRT